MNLRSKRRPLRARIPRSATRFRQVRAQSRAGFSRYEPYGVVLRLAARLGGNLASKQSVRQVVAVRASERGTQLRVLCALLALSIAAVVVLVGSRNDASIPAPAFVQAQ